MSKMLKKIPLSKYYQWVIYTDNHNSNQHQQ